MPSKKAVWSQFASENKSKYIEGKGFSQPFIIHNYRGLTVVITTYVISTGNSSATYTTAFVAFKNEKDIQFKIVKKNIFHRIFKSSKSKIIETGHIKFDNDYKIKGNDEIYVSRLFSDYDLRYLIEKQRQMYISINQNKGIHKKLYKDLNKRLEIEPLEDINLLFYQSSGVLKDTQRLLDLIKLFEKLIDLFIDLNIIRISDESL